MEKMLQSQSDDIAELNRLIRNYRADGPTRKTATYLQDKLYKFQQQFAKIRRVHANLDPFYTTNQPYWAEKTYEKLETQYNNIIDDINTRLKAAYNDEGSSTNFYDANTDQLNATMSDNINHMDTSGHQVGNDIPTNQAQHEANQDIPTNQDNTTNQTNTNNDLNQTRNEIPDEVIYAYNELMELVSAVNELNATLVTKGVAKTHMEMLQTAWGDYKGAINQHRAAITNFNNGAVTKRFMSASGKLNDILENNISNNTSSNTQFSLPKLKLPEFSGKPTEWKAFISLFDRMVHVNNQLDNGLKIEYFKTCVKGDAAKIINHIDATPENYNLCYNLLRKRYDNKREILGKLIDNILFIPKIKIESFDHLKNLHDVVYESIMSIRNIGISTNNWDPLLTHILTHKLDQSTVIHYECQLTDVKEPQSLESFLNYLENRFMALQSANSKTAFDKNSNNANNSNNSNNSKNSINSYNSQNSKNNYHRQNNNEKTSPISNGWKSCLCCNESHTIYKCQKFSQMPVNERFDWVKSKKLCVNCLKDSHKVSECNSKYKCKQCQKWHNSLLHFENKQIIHKSNLAQVNDIEDVTQISCNVVEMRRGSVLLATAIIGVLSKHGTIILLKALFDQGSTGMLITENAAQTLALKRNRVNAIVTGIGEKALVAKHSIDITVSPRFKSDFAITSEAIILSKLTKITAVNNDENDFEFINNLTLADPSFNKESEIDIILGAAEYAQAIRMGLIKSEKNFIAQNTSFGWIVSGAIIRKNKSSSSPVVTLVTNVELDEKLSQFFNSEDFEIKDEIALTEEEVYCEEHFNQNCYQNENGQFVVSMPFKNNMSTPELGDSRRIAVATQFQLERRFSAKPWLQQEYNNLMKEAIELGHIEEVQYNPERKCNYLSHHCVFKESTTTAVRIVYNASLKTSNGKSINEQLAIGASSQPSLLELLTKLRIYKYAFTADVEKMYKQMLINDDQLHYQHFVYRFDSNEPMREFCLKTITFGMANAPYLAIRVLKELAIRTENKYPIASNIILNSMYMDDVLGGCHSKSDLFETYSQLKLAFESARLNLRKWCSNSPELMNHIPDCNKEIRALSANVKALGISWCTNDDTFTYDFSIPMDSNPCTKRKLTSEMASMFDPLGWISPCIMRAKHILQLLWKVNADWDDVVPDIFVQQWISMKNEMHHISNLRIPRWINYDPKDRMQLHGFCDASEVGYAAVIYLKNVTKNTTSLFMAKSKVAPIKEEKNGANNTIPRLELCGALLLAKLMRSVIKILNFESEEVHLWTDSKIVLSWIHGNPKRFKTFVATRISNINKIVNKKNWHHVASADNAADCASRGLSPAELANHPIWWHGPDFLKNDTEFQELNIQQLDINCEENNLLANVATVSVAESILPNVSSYDKMKRIMAYVIRFINVCKNKNKCQQDSLTVDELEQSNELILKIIQRDTFEDEITQLKRKNMVPRCSKLVSLSPFLDEMGLLRVGGRIDKADLPYEAKHQVLLPSNHYVTELIVRDAHKKCLHGGPKLTEAVLREKFWITNSQRTIKKIIHGCLNCFRVNPKPLQQYMADLPAHRVNMVGKPFTNTAVDYAGPFATKLASDRGQKTLKSYIAIFVCTATKAVHLEAVTELTAEAFIAAFRRFVFRRGSVRNLYSDNGTNFVRANRILMEHAQLMEDEYHGKVCSELIILQTKWHFSPPGAPHFNGLAEAAVKSVKTHLKKTIADTKLTYEEFCTLLAQIEACVNSRPLCQLSSSPDDVGTLSPAHFLVGESLVAPPEVNHLEENTNWLNRWQRVQKMYQYFWSRWHADYLNQLQTRSKWNKINNGEPRKNELVLIRDENIPSTQWQTARVMEVHPGQDSLIRVVTLKTKNGSMKRPITKICPLPIDEGVVETKTNVVRIARSKPTHLGVLPILTAFLAICTSMTYQTQIDNPVEITRFDKSPGLYFEKTYDMYLTRANWNVLSYLHLGTLHDEFISIQTNLSAARAICYNKLANRTGCRNIVSHLENRVNSLAQKNSLLFHTHDRKKRATLDFIGNIASDLFGVAGPRFIENHKNDMRSFQKNQNDVKLLLKNHTSILEATLNVLKNDQTELEKQAQHFNVLTSQIMEGREIGEAEQDLNDALLYLSQVISEFERQQQALVHVIADSHKNLINHDVLTVHQINTQVEIILREVGSKYIVPTGIEIYEISHVYSYLLDKQYVFKIVIPLLEPKMYGIYRIIPMPILVDKRALGIMTSHNYIIVSSDREFFQYVDNFNVRDCDEYQRENQIVCGSPRLWFDRNRADCIWGVFNDMSYDGCELKEIPLESKLIELNNNDLLFSYHKASSIALLCNNSVIHKSLSGQGVLRIHEGCTLRGATDHYSPLRVISNTTENIIIPSISYNWTVALRNVETSDRLKFSKYVKHNLSDIESQLNFTRSFLENMNDKQMYTDVHQFSVLYVVLAAVVLYFAFKLWKYISISRKPAPAPRRIVMPTIYADPENVSV